MPEITTTGFPFIDRIPLKDRGAAIKKLGEWQLKRHGTELDIIAAARRGKLPVEPDIVVNAPNAAEEAEIETLKEMRSNTDIKGRPK